jgi:hypothetical protein
MSSVADFPSPFNGGGNFVLVKGDWVRTGDYTGSSSIGARIAAAQVARFRCGAPKRARAKRKTVRTVPAPEPIIAPPPVAPVEVAPEPPPEPQGVPMMVTRAMEAKLTALGYGQADIDRMTPQQAWDIIDAGTVAPAVVEVVTPLNGPPVADEPVYVPIRAAWPPEVTDELKASAEAFRRYVQPGRWDTVTARLAAEQSDPRRAADMAELREARRHLKQAEAALNAVPSLGSTTPLKRWRQSMRRPYECRVKSCRRRIEEIRKRWNLGSVPKFFRPRPATAADRRIAAQYKAQWTRGIRKGYAPEPPAAVAA